MRVLGLIGSVLVLWASVKALGMISLDYQWEMLLPLGQTLLFMGWCVVVHWLLEGEPR